MDNRPVNRKKNVTSGGSGVHRRGEGRGSGPVGSGGPSGSGSSGRRSGGSRAARGAGVSLPVLIIFVIAYLFFGGGGSHNNSSTGGLSSGSSYSSHTPGSDTSGGNSADSGDTGGSYSDFYEYYQQMMQNQADNSSDGGTSDGTTGNQNSGSYASLNHIDTDSDSLDTTIASGVPDKRTKILGGGKDTITIMVYMCGTDLESHSAMATSDLQEMLKSTLGKNINLLVYTGGCTRWQNNVVSSRVNQIYQISDGKMRQLVADDGARSMTDPGTLSDFIQWSAKNFPANRYDLIFWDHGGGSVSGYGYDEKYKRSGSMDLSEIRKALKAGGVTFDFIGFDACLMATAETALMTSEFADYMIASEESEPGIGWYYTNWLSKLSANTSMETTQIGKNIIDDFTTACARSCRGQKTTLSIIDLAEFSYTVPSKLNAFARSVRTKIASKEYKAVSDARYSAREFAPSSRIDQVDLVDMALKMNTTEGQNLAKTLQDTIKYNRTSANMTNAYGVSIYFPYQRTSYVDTACSTYSDIGMDEEYTKCIREFASLEASGQIIAGGSQAASPYASLFGSLLGSGSGNGNSSYSSSYDTLGSLLGGGSSSSDAISQLLGSFLSNPGILEGLTGSNSSFFSDRALSEEDTADYLAANYFDPTALTWKESKNGTATMSLSEEQWSLVHDLDLNMFYDDGEGYVDLGLDNIFSFDDKGNLVADTERNWLSIGGQVVAYYRESTIGTSDDYTITGYVPALLNGKEVQLILVFDTENPGGTIVGARSVYAEEETMEVPKNMTELTEGDRLEFLCDFYSYDGEFQDNYLLGEPLTVSNNLTISNTDVGDGEVKLMYRFTDIYNQEYWSEALTR